MSVEPRKRILKFGVVLLAVAAVAFAFRVAWRDRLNAVRLAEVEARLAAEVDAGRVAESEAELIRQANAARVADKKPPLQYDDAEALDARETARRNALYGRLFHPRRPRVFGAELCAAWAETPRDAVRRWLASENCKDILLGDYDRVAAGVATDEDGRTYRVLRLWQGDDGNDE